MKSLGISENEKQTLLLIEPDAPFSGALCSLLTEIYCIVARSNTEDGLSYLRQNIDTVSAVLMRAASQGAETFLSELRSNISLFMIPVLLLADEQEAPEEAELLRRGAVDCIHKPYHKAAICSRISNAVQLRDSLHFSEVERMLKELPSNIYLKDADGRYIFATHYWHHLKGKDEPGWTIRGKTDVEIRKDKENALSAMKADMEVIEKGKGTSYTIEINEDGIQEFLEIIKQPLINDEGRVTGIIGLINHVTEYELMKRKLEAIVRTDELTGLYSRHYFDEYFQNLRQQESYPICVIAADCDGLKYINDTFGHLVGDEYIRMASLLFRMVLPENGAVFRMGGDEFIILLPTASENVASEYIAQMREKESLFRIRGQKLSVSLGMSILESGEDSVSACIAAADQNMYQEKKHKQSKHAAHSRELR